MSNLTRNSNIELLRIVAILFIIAHHLLVHGMHIWDNASWGNLPILSLNSAFFVGVNVFVLISGYCGIKFRWSKLVYLWLMCALVGGSCYLLHLYIDGAHIGMSLIYNTLFSISHAPGTWYIQCYVFLLLVSPLINAGLEQMNKKQHLMVILAWSVISVYFGWWWQHNVNLDGYNLVNFIWLYCIGRYLKCYWNMQDAKPLLYIGIWVGCPISNAIISILFPQCPTWTYNNPLIVIASVSLLLFFVSFNFENKWVNSIATSTLGVYLIHENSYISQHIYSNRFVDFYANSILGFIVAVLLVYFACVITEVILRYFIAKPILKFTPPYIRKFIKEKQ